MECDMIEVIFEAIKDKLDKSVCEDLQGKLQQAEENLTLKYNGFQPRK